MIQVFRLLKENNKNEQKKKKHDFFLAYKSIYVIKWKFKIDRKHYYKSGQFFEICR